MAILFVAIRRDSVSLLRFLFLNHGTKYHGIIGIIVIMFGKKRG